MMKIWLLVTFQIIGAVWTVYIYNPLKMTSDIYLFFHIMPVHCGWLARERYVGQKYSEYHVETTRPVSRKDI